MAALAFGEAAVLLGFVLPGETAVLFGGVLSSMHHTNVAVMVPVAVTAAILGDSCGYEVGRIFGSRLLGVRPLRRHQHLVEAARDFLIRRGMWAVFVGRFTAFFRAMVPGLAGMAGMPYPRFLVANAAGGVVWATGFTLLGFAVGHAYQRVEKVSSLATGILAVVVVLALVGARVRSHLKERRLEAGVARPAGPPPAAGPGRAPASQAGPGLGSGSETAG